MFEAALSYLEDLGYETDRMSEKAIWSAIERNFSGGRNAFIQTVDRFITV